MVNMLEALLNSRDSSHHTLVGCAVRTVVVIVFREEQGVLCMLRHPALQDMIFVRLQEVQNMIENANRSKTILFA